MGTEEKASQVGGSFCSESYISIIETEIIREGGEARGKGEVSAGRREGDTTFFSRAKFPPRLVQSQIQILIFLFLPAQSRSQQELNFVARVFFFQGNVIILGWRTPRPATKPRRWPDPPTQYPLGRNIYSGLPENTPKIRRKYPQSPNTENARFGYFLGIFGYFLVVPEYRLGEYFLWKFRVGPTRGSVWFICLKVIVSVSKIWVGQDYPHDFYSKVAVSVSRKSLSELISKNDRCRFPEN